MVTIMPESHANVVGIKAEGKVTDEDYKTIIIPAIDAMLAENDKGNFLYYLSPEFAGFELGAMWDDFKYAAGHHTKFNRIALVGGPRWVEWSSKVCGHFVDAEVKAFEDSELEDAWNWVDSSKS